MIRNFKIFSKNKYKKTKIDLENKYMYEIFKNILILPLIFIAALEVNRSSQLFMPKEYKILKRIVNKLAANNSNLESILFSINIGRKLKKN